MRTGQKLERKPEDQVIDTISVQHPILLPFISGNRLELIPLDFFSRQAKFLTFYRIFRIMTPVGKNRPRAPRGRGGVRKGRKIERKLEDQIIDTISVLNPILVPFISGNSLELILLDFFLRQAKILTFFDFFEKSPVWA